jgi:hypothetical protein
MAIAKELPVFEQHAAIVVQGRVLHIFFDYASRPAARVSQQRALFRAGAVVGAISAGRHHISDNIL